MHKIKCPKCEIVDDHKIDDWQTHLHCRHCEACFTYRKITDSCVAIYDGWMPVFNKYGSYSNNGSL